MKFIIYTRDKGSQSAGIPESYGESDVYTLSQAETRGREMANYFNLTLRPHEKVREFVSAQMVYEPEQVKLINLQCYYYPNEVRFEATCDVLGKQIDLVFALNNSVISDSAFNVYYYILAEAVNMYYQTYVEVDTEKKGGDAK